MTNPALTPAPVPRLLSLDVVRGITIAFMIMVNNNGGSGSWRFMNHAEWNGLTPTDLVFPTFLFVVGVSIVFAFHARLKRGATRAQLAVHTVQRAVILCMLGIVLNGLGEIVLNGLFKRDLCKLDHLRFYGVLQRIAICYLIVGLFYIWDQRVWTKIVALVVALVGYWILLRWVPVPGAGMPGHEISFMDMRNNLVSWLDRLLMPHHLYLEWGGPDPHNLRDPEGLLSDLPAIGTTLLGLLTGLWLRTARPVKEKALGLAAGTVTCLALGYLWSLEFPLNKNMWTSSYVLVAAGYSLALLSVAFWAIELKRSRKGWTWPWVVFGSNAIAAYMFSGLVVIWLYKIRIPTGTDAPAFIVIERIVTDFFAHILSPGWAAFAYSVSFTAFCFIPVWILYRRKIFLKV